jgi:hypothetical protein
MYGSVLHHTEKVKRTAEERCPEGNTEDIAVTWKCCLMGSGMPMVCRLLLGGQGRVVLPWAHSSPASSYSVKKHSYYAMGNGK